MRVQENLSHLDGTGFVSGSHQILVKRRSIVPGHMSGHVPTKFEKFNDSGDSRLGFMSRVEEPEAAAL
ncbi:hypothetical protein KSP40_PGU020968 [Platanthera guangdongensis]|uniref:Uncharacterized protein n=1 Tax=Platanthera guangdongensis TaxID=2320717 RepID=A0ABR2MBX6_9ASPA